MKGMPAISLWLDSKFKAERGKRWDCRGGQQPDPEGLVCRAKCETEGSEADWKL